MNTGKMKLSNEWIARSQRAVWHPCTQMKHHEQLPLVPLARGAGAWLYDVDGQRYLDAISSWWVNLFGHTNAHINDAIKAQLDTLEHAMLAGCTHAPAIELAERLSALTGGVLGHAFFASDGASAVEIALKMSFHYWRNTMRPSKQEFVCIANGYHGETIGALGVTDVALFKTAYDPLLRHAHVAPSPDARQARAGESAADVARRSIAAITELLEARHTHIAAIIIEPLVQCAAGMAMHDPCFIAELRTLCDRYEVHLIADEIAVGCGRTGTFFAYEQASIQPDFLCLSKGISGGYLPLSAVLTREAIYAAFYDDDTARGFLHSHSYTGNPLACRAALATLDLFETEDVLTRNRSKSETLAGLLEPLAANPQVRHLRRCGTIIAFDVIPKTVTTDKALDKNSNKTSTPPVTFARRFFERALHNELLLRPIGNTVYLMPPYILSSEEITLLAARTCATLEQVLAEQA